MVNEKLPADLAAKQAEIRIMQRVLADAPTITPAYLDDLRAQVAASEEEVRQLVEAQAQQRASHTAAGDALQPFRVQAQTVQRKSEEAAERLDAKQKELHDVERRLAEAQQQLQQTVGGPVLRGEELKQYVNMLRAKSSVYKQKRAELAALQAEEDDLLQTLATLRKEHPTLLLVEADEDEAGGDTADKDQDSAERNDGDGDASTAPLSLDGDVDATLALPRGRTELVRLIDGLKRAVEAARERVRPMVQETVALRTKLADMADETEQAEQVSVILVRGYSLYF